MQVQYDRLVVIRDKRKEIRTSNNLTLQEFEEFKKNIFLNKKHFVTLVYIKDYAYVTISKLNAINIMEFIYYKNKDFTSTFLLEHYSFLNLLRL